MNEKGAVLIISLTFMTLLAMLGGTAVVMTTTDMKIGANYRDSGEALCNAESGMRYALGKMEAELKASSSTFYLPTTVGNSIDLDANAAFTTPTGFEFSFRPPGLTKLATNLYIFTTDGTGSNNASAAITVTCRQTPAINMAAFGDTKMDGKSGGTVESFDSSSSDPTKNDPTHPSFQSTHEADIGSNEWLVAHSGVDVDGNGVLGEDAGGTTAKDSIADYTDFYGNETPVADERIDPDPLGVNSGGEYDPTMYDGTPYPNNNCTGCTGTPISVCDDLCNNNELDLGSGDTITLTAGDYYINSGKGLELGNGSTLTIDASAGEVRIFLDGEGVTAANGSVLNVIGAATDFSVFSNSTVKIDFSNSSAFTGLVYAPFAPVDIKNDGSVMGAIWGSNVDIKNNGTLYYDSALADKYVKNDMERLTWLDVRN